MRSYEVDENISSKKEQSGSMIAYTLTGLDSFQAVKNERVLCFLL